MRRTYLALLGATAMLLVPLAGGADHCTVVASPTSLWPPNHKFHAITLTASGCDVDIVSVTQDEAVDAVGSGGTTDFDARNCVDDPAGNANAATVELRAERAGPGNGRVYSIMWNADGDHQSGTVTVAVPHDRSPNKSPVDGMAGLPSGAAC